MALALVAGGAACSSAPKKTTPELAKFLGKKVALVGVDGEETARAICEVALVNQLRARGTFELLPQSAVNAARTAHDIDSTSDAAVARRAGAELSLRARVLKFSAEEREGYDAVVEEDSQMEAETGNAQTKRVFKVATLLGTVEVELRFQDLETSEVRVATAKAEKSTYAESKYKAGHLPPKLGFLEGLANEAFRDFFERYN